jgi:arabinogalactan oligomer/maltooligosaccharide transport system substrate-binding protein
MRRLLALVSCSLLLTTTIALAPPATAAETPVVSIWHGYSGSGSAEGEAFDTVLARAAARHPGWTITGEDRGFDNLFSDFFTYAPTGVPDLMVAPNDVLYWEWQSGLIADVTPTVLARARSLRPQAISGSRVDGRIVQVPESLKAIALYYDRVAMPRPPTTTGQLLGALRAGKKLGVLGFGGEPYFLYGFYGSFGGTIMDADGVCVADQTPGVARAMAWLHDAVAAGLEVFPDTASATQALADGSISGFLDGNWSFGQVKAALGDRMGVVTGPSGPGGPFRPLVGVDGYVVNAATLDPESALTVALEMTNRAAQRTFMNLAGHVPADRTIAITDDRIGAFATATQQGVLRPMMAEFDAYWGWFGQALADVIYGDADAAQAVATACAGMNADNGK